MRNVNKNKHPAIEKNSVNYLNQATEAWCRLCIFHIRQKKQLGNQYQDQDKNYEYKTG